MTLLICRTCPRYDARSSGEFGRQLAAAIADNPAGASVAVRNVQCLGGCPDDGVVAADGPGKARVRFSGLGAADAEVVVKAATAHDASRTGLPVDWEIPAELAERISSVDHAGQFVLDPMDRRPAATQPRSGGSRRPTLLIVQHVSGLREAE